MSWTQLNALYLYWGLVWNEIVWHCNGLNTVCVFAGDAERKKRMEKVKTNRTRKGGKGANRDDPGTPEEGDPLSPGSETPVPSPSPSLASVGPMTPGNPQTPMTLSAPGTPMPTSPGSLSIINGQAMSPTLTASQVNTCNLLTLLSARGPSITTDLQQAMTDQNFLRKLTQEENFHIIRASAGVWTIVYSGPGAVGAHQACRPHDKPTSQSVFNHRFTYYKVRKTTGGIH